MTTTVLPALPVRSEQRAVLITLIKARGQPLDCAQIASRLEAVRSDSAVRSPTPSDVLATLQALRLHPVLSDAIRVTPAGTPGRVAPAFPVAMALPSLVCAAALTACAATGPAPVTALQSYFPAGAHHASVLAPPHPTLLEPQAVDCSRELCVFSPSGLSSWVTPKSPDYSATAISYFPGSPDEGLTAAPEIRLATLSDTLPGLQPPAPTLESDLVPLPSTPLEPLDHASVRLAQSLAPARAEISRMLTAMGDVHPVSLGVGLSVADLHRVLSFANGSDRISEVARSQAQAIAAAMTDSSRIELRGRVGKRTMTPDDARLALSRAIAVRRVLVEAGVPRSRIRIRLPRDGDLLDRSNFSSPLNLSVSVMVSEASVVSATAPAPGSRL